MKYAHRISYERIFDDAHFSKHLDFIKENIDVVDEITIKAEVSHSANYSKEFIVNLAKLLEKRIAQYRSIGVKSVGINCMSTIGHCEEAWTVLTPIPLQHIIGINGEELKSCLCFTNDEFLEYVKYKYSLYAKCSPDFIWADDDIRVNFHGTKECCFCPKCIDGFNKKFGYNFKSREDLVHALNDEKIKTDWDNFRDGAIEKLMQTIHDSVVAVNPNIKLGFMACHFNNRPDWIDALGATMGRPGGGFYSDERPLELFLKGISVSRQTRAFSLASNVNDVQYELENFNYTTLNKSYRFADIETAYCCMTGCNGILYNDMHFEDRPQLMAIIKNKKNFYNKLSTICKNTQLNGVYVVDEDMAYRFNEAGFAFADCMENANCCVILGDDWDKLSDEKVMEILSKGLLTDGLGVEKLTARGFNKYLGGSISKINDSGYAERFTNHPFNGKHKGFFRNVFMNFFNYNAKSYEFTVEEGAEVISTAESIIFEKGGVSAYVYENSLGGRIAVDGYLFPEYIKSESKITQLKSVINYISKGDVFYNLEECVKIVPTVRRGENTVLMLLNAGYLDSKELNVTIKKEGKFYYIADSGKLKKAKQKVQNGYTKITIKNIKPWQYLVLTERV